MNISKKLKRRSVLAAVCLFLLLAAMPKEARGAAAIETERKDCTMKISLSSDFGEPDGLSVPIAAYRVASVNTGGVWQPESGYDGIGLEDVSFETTAADWEKIGKEAAKIAAPEAMDEKGRLVVNELPAGSRTPDAEIIVSGTQENVLENLETGMYLILAFAVDTSEYNYSFSPCLVSVPGNGYIYDETGVGSGDDTWVYDVSVTLKPERTERYGSLEITKRLDAYHTGTGASFIFQVEAQKTVEGVQRTVYSNVVRLVFDGPGSKSVLIENKIPAGASVTVTEIYKGTAYEASDGDVRRDILIRADSTASAAFTNTYGGGLNGGGSIVNNFRPVFGTGQDGEEIVENWQWTQIQE